MNNMQELIVKYKRISCMHFDGKVETEDTRYRIKLSKNKLVKWLIKNDFRFSIGINGNELIDNLNYVEVWSNSFLAENHYEKNKLIEKYLEKYSVVKGR